MHGKRVHIRMAQSMGRVGTDQTMYTPRVVEIAEGTEYDYPLPYSVSVQIQRESRVAY